MKALVLDDDPGLCEIISSVLDEVGVPYSAFQDPLEALEAFADAEYDFALVDIGLPGMDGLEFSKHFKKRLPQADVVFITGSGDYDKAIQAIKLGAYDFLRKPFQRSEIRMCLRRLVEKRELYEANKRKEILSFANRMSLQLMHELRNPLTAIGGFSKRLQEADCQDAKIKEYATIVFNESVRFERAFNEVLTCLKSGAEDEAGDHPEPHRG